LITCPSHCKPGGSSRPEKHLEFPARRNPGRKIMIDKKCPEPEVIEDSFSYLNRYFRRWRGP